MSDLRRTTDLSHSRAIERVTEALADEGFGVLTEIDVAAVLKAKLDVDRRPYRILGACSPAFAHRALEANPEVGTLLPCNVVVYQDDQGRTIVSAVDPASLLPADSPELEAISGEVRARLVRALAVL